MLKSTCAVYLGQQSEQMFCGCIAEDNIFLVLTGENLPKEQGHSLIKDIKEELFNQEINTLATFTNVLNDCIQNAKLTSSVSYAVGLITHENLLYLKTVGEGQISVYRGNKLAKIMEGMHTASGKAIMHDVFVFTTKQFSETISASELQTTLRGVELPQVIESLHSKEASIKSEGLLSLFVSFSEQEQDVQESIMIQQKEEEVLQEADQKETQGEEVMINSPKKNILQPLFASLAQLRSKGGKKKTITFCIVVIIFVLLIWSVGLGYGRRQAQAQAKKIKDIRQSVIRKLTEAEDAAFLSPSRSAELIQEAKNETGFLRADVGDAHYKEVKEIEALITDKENQITKKEDKSYSEFYDLSLHAKGSQGDKIYVSGENAAILDTKNSTIYILSLAQKSLDKIKVSVIKNASLIALDDKSTIFYVPSEGVYTSTNKSAKKVLDSDTDWKEIKEIHLFNSNLYLLDEPNNQIYKYIVTENGYSSKSSYLQSSLEYPPLSFAIDSSVYISLGDRIQKFISGAGEDFKTTFPQNDVHIDKVITNKDMEKVYGWDKKKGALYIMGKSGEYERQINSSILAKASDVEIYNNNAFIILKEKIFQISLD